MPVRIRFTGPATLNSTLTVQWQGGYPPSGTASAIETFKTLRTTAWQTTIGTDATSQALNYFAALSTDFSVNFTITRIGNDVIVNPKNGTQVVSATTSSANIIINPSVAQIQALGRPQPFIPVYNPIVYKFFSNQYSASGYRYLVDLYNNETNEKIYSAKIAPQIDGTGYIDISKPLSNFTSVDWIQNQQFIDNCRNSYINARIEIGEEYQVNWTFNQIITASSSGNCQLLQTPTITPHTYVVGDQISIDTDIVSTDPMSITNGLHTVMSVSTYSVTIDAIKPTVGTISTAGITAYADGRKTSFSNVLTYDITAFNGVRTWTEFPNWDWQHWFIQYGIYQSPDCELLTSLRINAETQNPDDRFYMTPSQQIWLNMAVDSPNNEWTVNWSASNEDGSIGYDSGSFTITNNSGDNGTIKQFRICPDELIGFSSNYDLIEKITFRVVDDQDEAVTRYYGIYLDKRCRIEKYELYFMDRMGSILSFACQLRAKETGTITKEMGKQQIFYNEQPTTYTTPVYDTTDRGMSVNSVNLVKDLELNTNWMNNEMSLLFEELLTSPYVWLRTVLEPTNELPERNIYTSVIVNETNFEVQKQKNKRLIRKTINVKSANEDIINI